MKEECSDVFLLNHTKRMIGWDDEFICLGWAKAKVKPKPLSNLWRLWCWRIQCGKWCIRLAIPNCFKEGIGFRDHVGTPNWLQTNSFLFFPYIYIYLFLIKSIYWITIMTEFIGDLMWFSQHAGSWGHPKMSRRGGEALGCLALPVMACSEETKQQSTKPFF